MGWFPMISILRKKIMGLDLYLNVAQDSSFIPYQSNPYICVSSHLPILFIVLSSQRALHVILVQGQEWTVLGSNHNII